LTVSESSNATSSELFALMVWCFCIFLGGAGCSTPQLPLVVHPAPSASPQCVQPIATTGASARKLAFFKRPVFQAADVKRVYQCALAKVPAADTLQPLQENAILRIYPSFRFPVFYSLTFSIMGSAGKTLPPTGSNNSTTLMPVK